MNLLCEISTLNNGCGPWFQVPGSMVRSPWFQGPWIHGPWSVVNGSMVKIVNER